MNKIKVGNVILGNEMPKICTSIIGKTKEEIKKQSENLLNMEVDVVEWRCDFFDYALDKNEVCNMIKEIKFILKEKPLIFTMRSKEEGGEISISEEEYFELYKYICEKEFVDIIDVELKIGKDKIEEIISKCHENNIKVIISKHDFEKTPSKESMLEDLVYMQQLKADIPKLAVMPSNDLDVIRLLEVTAMMKSKYNETPIITISMGEKGIISRMSGEVFGSCLTFASGGKASAPGQISVKDLKTMLEIINKYKSEDFNIMLIGFMGTGKTSISVELSKLLNMEVIDTDQYIEEKENQSISEIFKNYNEEYFRNCETNTLKELSNKKNIILSCGGGIILKDENIEIMKKQGKVVLLKASPQTIYDRVKKSSTRPLLNNNMTVNHISNLMDSRKEKYEKAADIIIDTDNKSIEEICEEIIKKL